jgi:hypothetical protein
LSWLVSKIPEHIFVVNIRLNNSLLDFYSHIIFIWIWKISVCIFFSTKENKRTVSCFSFRCGITLSHKYLKKMISMRLMLEY